MRKNVLLVDDDKIFNFLNEKTIAAMGLANQIHTALNGKEALQVFNQYFSGMMAIPDVIFLDLNMPIMDGFEFIQAFQSINFPNKEKVLIVIVTSSADPNDVARAKSLGIRHYINKPITEEAIKSILHQEFEKTV